MRCTNERGVSPLHRRTVDGSRVKSRADGGMGRAEVSAIWIPRSKTAVDYIGFSISGGTSNAAWKI